MKTAKLILAALVLAFAPQTRAACSVSGATSSSAAVPGDLLFEMLAKAPVCPASVQELKRLLARDGIVPLPAMVANRGRNNPELGSFSFFEVVAVEKNAAIFFGHFTRIENAAVSLDQSPARGSLMVELIAWDKNKGLFNFYELIGDGQKGNWFYRGDSKDALDDNKDLYLNPPGDRPAFGNRMRCSGCHASGGPVMKELKLPHNDWWRTTRPLSLGTHEASREVASLEANLIDASQFADFVKRGINRLEASSTYQVIKSQRTLREQLRPIFCETEINLESSVQPSEAPALTVMLPTASIINPFLLEPSSQFEIEIDAAKYQQKLIEFGMQFPETDLADADHPWLVPVKGYSDHLAIASLISTKKINEKFALDVLSTDLSTPAFSAKRCALLKLVPNTVDWKNEFMNRLKASPTPEARQLAEKMVDATKDAEWHRAFATKFIASKKAAVLKDEGLNSEFIHLIETRNAVFSSDISKNPLGQILEPGFRVIFPEPSAVAR